MSAQLDDLLNRWEARDQFYASRRRGMAIETIEAIRAARVREVHALPVEDRPAAYLRAKTWEPR